MSCAPGQILHTHPDTTYYVYVYINQRLVNNIYCELQL